MLHSSKIWTVINSEKDLPILNKNVIALVEYNSESNEDFPFVDEFILESYNDFFRWRLVNFDSENQEEYLQQFLTVIAWRYKQTE